jgi:hypothetical protein
MVGKAGEQKGRVCEVALSAHPALLPRAAATSNSKRSGLSGHHVLHATGVQVTTQQASLHLDCAPVQGHVSISFHTATAQEVA